MCMGDVVGGRYRLVRPIAKGGQAEVWEAQQAPFNQRVALKILIPRCGALGRERLQREARVLAGLNHPNIVRIIDCGDVGEGWYLAMEYIEGPRFKSLLRARQHSPRALLFLVEQVCAGLEAAHRRGVIHRDIKLSNILVHRAAGVREQARLVDFGIARLMEEDPGLTSEGIVLGSPRFMAPELIRGQPIDARVDVYAVGVLLFCCLMGRYPFSGRSPHEIMRAHLSCPLPTVHVPYGLPNRTSLAALVQRAMARDREDRFTSIAELRSTLNALLFDLEGHPEGGDSRRSMRL